MATFRYTKESDVDEIDRIWKTFYSNEFSLPDLSNTIIHGVVETDKGITGFGMVKLMAEGLLILDQSVSDKVKMATLKELMIAQRVGVSKTNLTQIHAFVQDPRFANILKKHYGYTDAVGKALVLEVD